jgi:hypothetical protein
MANSPRLVRLRLAARAASRRLLPLDREIAQENSL